jgi:hypothetical protein
MGVGVGVGASDLWEELGVRMRVHMYCVSTYVKQLL